MLTEPVNLTGFEGDCSGYAGRTLLIGPTSPSNVAMLRTRLPWLVARPLRPAHLSGHGRSAGTGNARSRSGCACRAGQDPSNLCPSVYWAVLKEKGSDSYLRFLGRLAGLLRAHAEEYARNLETHFCI